MLATARQPITDLARGGRHRRAIVVRISGTPARPSVRAAMAEAGLARRRASAASASTPPARWSCSTAAATRSPSARPATRSATSSSGWIIAPSAEARRINETGDDGAALCRRLDLARDGNAEAAVAEASTCRRPSPRPAISSILPTILSWRATGSHGALDLHGRPANGPISRMNGAGADTTSSAIGLGELADERLCADRHRDRRARHRARRRPDAGRPRPSSACCRARRSAPALIDAHAGGVGTIGGRARTARRPMSRPPRLRHGNVGLHHGDDRRRRASCRACGGRISRRWCPASG